MNAEKVNYKTTLNLPRTDFAMEAKLVRNEPGRLAKWQKMGLYRMLMEARSTCPRWVLHDGPPFANGDIHIGHVINKTLKDVVLRFRSMQGYQTPYVPGWDCHGLPIEHKIQEQIGPGWRDVPVADLRRRCHEYAARYAAIQSQQFQRLGVLGDWGRPYLTMDPQYEAATLNVFAAFVDAGLVYRKLKPVAWSVSNQTALADAELEYMDIEDASVYVEFPDAGEGGVEGLHYLIWTTTPWTLPANLAIAVHPDVEYAFVKYTRAGTTRVGVVAVPLLERVFEGRPDVQRREVVRTVAGRELVGRRYRHPFMDRVCPIVPAEYVTTTDGTGLVHTAPGHGEDDYNTGQAFNLPTYCPVLASGRFDDSVPEWIRGKNVFEANPVIIARLRELGVLFAEERIVHSYPHDWRSKKPVILRATEQWFISVDKPFSVKGAADGSAADAPRSLRQRAIEAVTSQVQMIPAWGAARIRGMLESRPDWCISRQRAWGLPVPVFYNDKDEPLLTGESVRAVARTFARKGSDAWFTDTPAELLGPDFRYPPGFEPEKLRKEKDILDVWFESGSSWAAVCMARPELKFPADMYLEGSDQHRGWFQLSLLPALGVTGRPPFKQVLTHGFVVKPDGTKVAKSDKEYVTATEEVNRHGADLLRLWCCSMDYQNDIPASPQIIRDFGDKYRKIRNTLRYLLSNLYDYQPPAHVRDDAPPVPMQSLDAWALAELDRLIEEVTAAYDNYQLHRAFRLLHDFCAVQISAIYGNAMKDRLYCEPADSPLRRRCQYVMHRMVLALTKLLAPMLVFTADEAWEHIPHKPAEEASLPSVHLALLPRPSGMKVSEEQRRQWKMLLDLRDEALLQLDHLKKSAGLNKALDAELVYQVDEPTRQSLEPYGPDLEDIVGAGCHSFAPGGPQPKVKVVDRRNDYRACARSWKRRPDVGSDPQYPDLSARDAAAVRAAAR